MHSAGHSTFCVPRAWLTPTCSPVMFAVVMILAYYGSFEIKQTPAIMGHGLAFSTSSLVVAASPPTTLMLSTLR